MKLIDRELTGKIIQGFHEVHRILGPGYLESIYKNALVIDLQKKNIKCETERLVEIYYCEKKVGEHRLDLLVEDKVIVELKAVKEFHPTHTAQIISYLKATGLKIALLVNFGKDKIEYKRFIL